MFADKELDDILERSLQQLGITGKKDVPIKGENMLHPANSNSTNSGSSSSSGSCVLSMNYQKFIWHTNEPFFPFGETPAKFLLANTPLTLPVVKVLLVGARDLRHLLYTAWTMCQGNYPGALANRQKIECVFCESNACSLARNIVFLRLLANGQATMNQLWTIFYAKAIDLPCVELVQQCAKDLLTTSTLAEWHASEFGGVIRFCDNKTFIAVREIWWIYFSRAILPDDDRRLKAEWKNFEDTYSRNVRPPSNFNNNNVPKEAQSRGVADASHKSNHSVPSGDPCFLETLANIGAHNDVRLEYSDHGRPPACIHNPASSQESIESRWYFNPTMLFGPSQSYRLYSSLDPTLGFHLSMLYVNNYVPRGPGTTSSSSTLVSVEGNSLPIYDVTPSIIYRCAFDQFAAWCASFKDLVESAGGILLRCCCADPVDFFSAVTAQRTAIAGSNNRGVHFVPPFSFAPCYFEPDVPTEFDVIDIGGQVTDQYGLVTTLLHGLPLLETASHSVLTTDIVAMVQASSSPPTSGTISQHRKQQYFQTFFDRELHMDMATLCAFMGCVMLDYHLQHTPYFKNIKEGFRCEYLSQNAEISMCVDWKLSYVAERMLVQGSEFQSICQQLYRWVFLYEQATDFAYYEGFEVDEFNSFFRANDAATDATHDDPLALGKQTPAGGVRRVWEIRYDMMRSNLHAFVRFIAHACHHHVLVLDQEQVIAGLICSFQTDYENLVTKEQLQAPSLMEFSFWCYHYNLLGPDAMRRCMVDTGMIISTVPSSISDTCSTASSSSSTAAANSSSILVQSVLVTLLVPREDLCEGLGSVKFPNVDMVVFSELAGGNHHRFSSFHVAYVRKRIMHSKTTAARSSTHDEISNGNKGRTTEGTSALLSENSGTFRFKHFSLVSGSESEHEYVSFSCYVPSVALFGSPTTTTTAAVTASDISSVDRAKQLVDNVQIALCLRGSALRRCAYLPLSLAGAQPWTQNNANSNYRKMPQSPSSTPKLPSPPTQPFAPGMHVLHSAKLSNNRLCSWVALDAPNQHQNHQLHCSTRTPQALEPMAPFPRVRPPSRFLTSHNGSGHGSDGQFSTKYSKNNGNGNYKASGMDRQIAVVSPFSMALSPDGALQSVSFTVTPKDPSLSQQLRRPPCAGMSAVVVATASSVVGPSASRLAGSVLTSSNGSEWQYLATTTAGNNNTAGISYGQRYDFRGNMTSHPLVLRIVLENYQGAKTSSTLAISKQAPLLVVECMCPGMLDLTTARCIINRAAGVVHVTLFVRRQFQYQEQEHSQSQFAVRGLFPMYREGAYLHFWGQKRLVLDALPAIERYAQSVVPSKQRVEVAASTTAAKGNEKSVELAYLWLLITMQYTQDETIHRFSPSHTSSTSSTSSSDTDDDLQHHHLRSLTALSSMKETIHYITCGFIGQTTPKDKMTTSPSDAALPLRKRLFFLSCSKSEFVGVQVIIYVNDLRLDPGTCGSVVLDVAVCMVTMKNFHLVAHFIEKELADETDNTHGNSNENSAGDDTSGTNDVDGWPGISQTMVTDAELELWKEMLPVACERVRNSWKHDPLRCEYFTAGGISSSNANDGMNQGCTKGHGAAGSPPKVAPDQSVLCSCCLGKGHQGTPFFAKYSKSKLFSQFFRAAVSPVFQPFFFRPEGCCSTVYDPRQLQSDGNDGESGGHVIIGPTIPPPSLLPAKPSFSSGGAADYPTQLLDSVASAASAAFGGERQLACGHCGITEGKLSRCSRCKSVHYCSQACQKRHWTLGHKLVCQQQQQQQQPAVIPV